MDPCNTCVNESHCSTCKNGSGYLTSGQCVDAGNCPAGTYADDATLKCVNCPSGCSLCTSPTFCTQCIEVYFFYENQCLLSCPTGSFKEGSICQNCTFPCATCINTSINCLSCSSPTVFYQNSCIGSCPDSTYNSSGNCVSCMSTCLTCSTGTTCNTCTGSLYFHSNVCLATCPAGTFSNILTNQCTSCTSPCS